MGRNRQSAKQAGTAMESAICKFLSERLGVIVERRAKKGAKDEGDISGVYINGHPLVIEAKNVAQMALPQWTKEAEMEAENAKALCGLVVHKRHGVGITSMDGIGKQWVTCTLDDLVALITGEVQRKTEIDKEGK